MDEVTIARTGRDFRSLQPIPSRPIWLLICYLGGGLLGLVGMVIGPDLPLKPETATPIKTFWIAVLLAQVFFGRPGGIVALVLSLLAMFCHSQVNLAMIKWAGVEVTGWLLIIILVSQNRNSRRWILRAWRALARRSGHRARDNQATHCRQRRLLRARPLRRQERSAALAARP
jgi:hypothetical protein